MSAFDSFPLGQPAFVTHVLDRAAHLRNDDAKLLALEGKRDTRAYVVHRDSLVVNKENGSSRALLTIDEALNTAPIPAPSSSACARVRRSSAWASARRRWKSC